MGAFEKAKGEIKETVGRMTDDPDLQREGSAQSEKGEAEMDAAKARAQAEAHEAKAKVKETEQDMAERAK
jgi:uncharacterized protein YjbJ (UPF0337 family)